MGRAPCCEKDRVKRGPWTPEEDARLLACVAQHGTGSWRTIPKKAGLQRCGKSCRLRWTNYLRPDLKHGRFSEHEEQTIVKLHAALGSRWSLIAAQLPGRTDNDVKNYWNTRLKKKLCEMGIDPITHKPISQLLADLAGSMSAMQRPPAAAGQQAQLAQQLMSSSAVGAAATPSRMIPDASALGCFKDDMLNVMMRLNPASIVASAPLHSSCLCAATPLGSPSMYAASIFDHDPLGSPCLMSACTSSPCTGQLQPPPPPRMAAFSTSSPNPAGNTLAVEHNLLQPQLLPKFPPLMQSLTRPSFCTTMSYGFGQYLPQNSKARVQDINMALDAQYNTPSSSSSTCTHELATVSGVMPKRSNISNDEASSLNVQIGTTHILQDGHNCSVLNESITILSDTGDKFLSSQAGSQVQYMAEPRCPWFNSQEELSLIIDKEDQAHGVSLFNWEKINEEADHASSSLCVKSKGGNGMNAWSPTCTSRSSSTCSNLPGHLDSNTPSHNLNIKQPPLTSSIDAILWDLADLNAFIS